MTWLSGKSHDVAPLAKFGAATEKNKAAKLAATVPARGGREPKPRVGSPLLSWEN